MSNYMASFLLRYVKNAFVVLLLWLSLSSTAQTPGGPALPTATPVALPAPYTNSVVSYVRTWEPSAPISDPAAVIANLPVSQVKQSTQYFDGLGRLLQTVSKGMSGGGKDIVSAISYDEFGREQFKYLPYVPQSGNTDDGKFKTTPFSSQWDFYKANPGTANETVFYSQVEFEASPLNRVLRTYAPGNSWTKTGGNHPLVQQYLINTAADSVRIWDVPATGYPGSTKIYAPGQLYKNVTADENGSPITEYKDKEGRVMLKKAQLSNSAGSAHMGWLCTYYVYDDLGNLRFVIPPLAVEKITNSWNVSTVAEELCFQYRYDGRNRMIEKKVPGAAVVEMVYDIRDRLVFIRDGNLKARNKWHVTFYDALNRPVETALYGNTATREMLQASMNTAVNNTGSSTYNFPGVADLVIATHNRNLYEATNSVTVEKGFDSGNNAEIEIRINPAANGGVANITVSNPLPDIFSGDLMPMTFTFYDKYDFPGKQAQVTDDFGMATSADPHAEPVSVGSRTTGLLTGARIRVLDTDTWLTSSIYYNDKGRISQTITDNAVGGQDINTTRYDFTGKVVSTYLRHRNPRSGLTPEATVLTSMIYNDQDRLIAVQKQVNDKASLVRTIARNEYDELGQLKTKELGINGSAAPLERLSYEYNVRGWLKTISKEYLDGSDARSHFGQELNYDYGFLNRNFNGNISGIRWKGWNNKEPRAYGYAYDQVSRLTGAEFSQQNTTSASWTKDKVDFTVSQLNYDANGNITRMAQRGLLNGASADVDNLTYTYQGNSNKLSSVYDVVQLKTGLGDFTNSTANTVDYDYDPNGNLKRDDNKNITAISYNQLNLPQEILIKDKGSIRFQYDASGNKVRKTVTDITATPSKVTSTDYIGGFAYQNDTLQFIPQDEGRVRLVYKPNLAPEFYYDYFVKDHLGNTRLVLTEQTDLSIYTATMETPAAAKETALFSNIDNTRANKPVGYPTDESAGQNESVARLTALGSGKKIGPSLVLRVMAGDTIQVGAKAFYKSTGPQERSSTDVPAENILADLVQAFGGNAATSGDHGGAVPSQQTPFNTNFYNNDYQRLKDKDPNDQRQNKPKAYLNFVLFDDQFNLVEENSGAKQVGATPDELQTLAQDKMPVKKSGFLYVYTSNESPQDVFFDNVVVTLASGPVLEETHYYPFGLTMAGISSNALKGANYAENKLKYNGKELQNKEFGDGSGLEWYDFGARKLDPQIGRWNSIDPLADKFYHFSPYVSMGDNPIRHIDPNGKKFLNFDADGNYTGTTKDNWWHNLWHGSKGRILDDQGTVTQKFSFADPKNDVKDIQSGVIKRVEFVKESDIKDMLFKAGVFDSENKLENRNSRYEYIREQGQGGGRLDFSYNGIRAQYPQASNRPVTVATTMIFLVDGVAHNHMNFGNFLFGAAGAALGLSLPELLGGGQYNSLINTKGNNYNSQFDSSDDQYSIMKGFEHGYSNYYKETEYSGKTEVGPLLPISVF